MTNTVKENQPAFNGLSYTYNIDMVVRQIRTITFDAVVAYAIEMGYDPSTMTINQLFNHFGPAVAAKWAETTVVEGDTTITAHPRKGVLPE
jgi:hypothetical protein